MIKRLNDEQRQFAEENSGVINWFLFKTGYRVDDFYDIAALGFTKAVRIYLEKPVLHQYKFSTIAWRYMRYAIYDYFRYINRKKRKATVISVDDYRPDQPNPVQAIAATDADPYQMAEEKQFWSRIYAALDQRQKVMLSLRLAGYSFEEVADTFEISCNEVQSELENIFQSISI